MRVFGIITLVALLLVVVIGSIIERSQHTYAETVTVDGVTFHNVDVCPASRQVNFTREGRKFTIWRNGNQLVVCELDQDCSEGETPSVPEEVALWKKYFGELPNLPKD